jgi:rfaE bifunctional protein nucleotidyltransferase chain/domain
MGRLVAFEDLRGIRDSSAPQTVIHCHGVFDLLHYGHLLHLKSAKRMGDCLVVTVTSDRFVNKGPGRPRFTDVQRASMLAALEFVDYVAISDKPTADFAIDILRPHIFVKGPDYANPSMQQSPEIALERTAVERHGGKIIFTDDATESSSRLLNSFLSNWNQEQIATVEKLRAITSLAQIVDMLESAARCRILVVGEPTIDTYIFCDVNGTTNKTPTLSATANEQEDYAGGSLAIANHLAALGADVTLVVPHGGESYYDDVLLRGISPTIRLEGVRIDQFITPRKTRYVVPFQMNKLFQVVRAPTGVLDPRAITPYFDRLDELAADNDLVVVADYGFGLFEEVGLPHLERLRSFIALNVQTNATNYGFNLFSKHARFDYLSLNEREFRLGLGRRYGDLTDLFREAHSGKITCPFSVTVGPKGSWFSASDGSIHSSPGFFTDIIDTVGAGDAFFAITALGVHHGMPSLVIPFIGNCFGGLQSRIIGNKAPVSKTDLIRTITALLS